MERRKRAFDIETIPDLSILHRLPEPEVAVGNLVDPVKIAAKVAEAKAKRLEKLALNPLTGKVCCIGWWDDEIGLAECSESESVLLGRAYQMFQTFHIVTWNGKAFDVPFIFKRGIILKLSWATIPNMKTISDRYKAFNHTDLMEEWGGGHYGEFEKLDTLARVILGETKTERDYTKYPEMMLTEAGRARIEVDCACDARLVWDLAKRCGFNNDRVA